MRNRKKERGNANLIEEVSAFNELRPQLVLGPEGLKLSGKSLHKKERERERERERVVKSW